MTETERGRAEVIDAQKAARNAQRESEALLAQSREAREKLRSAREDWFVRRLQATIRG